jgi:transposase-like protein
VLVAQLSKPYGHSYTDRQGELQHEEAAPPVGITKTVLQQWRIQNNKEIDSVEPPSRSCALAASQGPIQHPRRGAVAPAEAAMLGKSQAAWRIAGCL